jgi:hypothetical protein
MYSVFRRYSIVARAALLLACAALPLADAATLAAQTTTQTTPQTTTQEAPKKSEPAKPEKAPKKNELAAPTAEQVAETVILVHGVRERLAQVRRSGVERGRISRTTDDGRTEEITYERSFKRGESAEKDKIRLDQKRPNIEYALVYNEGRVFGVLRGTAFTPRQDDVSVFLADTRHGVDTLLRYKENGATLAYVGKEKQKNIDMWLLDLTDKEQRRTRYYISAQSGRVLWLEYEDTRPGSSAPVKYKRTFHDYRTIQGTRMPYRTVLYADGKQVEESQILTVVYGVKMEDTVFQNPEAASTP